MLTALRTRAKLHLLCVTYDYQGRVKTPLFLLFLFYPKLVTQTSQHPL
jgi:hypothetical protein